MADWPPTSASPRWCAQLLLNRGLRETATARRFLDAPLTGLHPPHSSARRRRGRRPALGGRSGRRKITVYGDYDVDGVTGTAILLQALTLLGADADFYVPHRLDEGYGLNLRGPAATRRRRQPKSSSRSIAASVPARRPTKPAGSGWN